MSIGGLMPGIDLEDIMVGISVCWNQDLANVFYRLHLIEAYGTGMGKIMKAVSYTHLDVYKRQDLVSLKPCYMFFWHSN